LGISVTKIKNACVIELSGELGVEGVHDLDDKFKALIKKGERYFVLDMSDLDFIDSAGMASLVLNHKQIVAANGKMVLAALQISVRKVLQLTRTDQVFQIYEKLSTAINSFTSL